MKYYAIKPLTEGPCSHLVIKQRLRGRKTTNQDHFDM